MQGDFEKKVQEKMDELRLTPSAPVWEKIELEIRPEEKRRRVLLWIPFLFLLLGAAGWWILSGRDISPGKQEAITTGDGTPATIQTPGTQKTTIASVSITKENVPAAVQTVPHNRSGRGLIVPAEPRAATEETGYARNAITALLQRKRGDIATTEETIIDKPVTENNTEKTSEPVAETQPIAQEPTNRSVATDTTTQVQKSIPTEQPSANDSALRKTKIATAQSWRKTFSVRVGVSRPSSMPGAFGGNRDAYSTTPSPTTNVSGGMVTESSATSGFSFAVGAGLSRPVGKRWELSFGLQYAFYSTRMNVGAFRQHDTAISFAGGPVRVDGFYRNGRQTEYTNRFHILEIPVSLSFRPMLKLPLTLTAGASYGRLLQSNALTFDRSGNLYYQNKENVRRNHAAVFSSLQFRLLKGRSRSLDAGPFVQHQFTRLQVQGSNAPRMLTGGLKAIINF